MAELGSIEFQDPQSGGGAGDRRDVAAALGAAGGVLVEARNRDILGNFREDTKKIIEEAEVQEQVRLPIATGNPDIDKFRNKMSVLRASSLQGSTSQRALAELQIRRLLNQMESRYPRLRDELRTEFGALLRTDSALDELGFKDVSNAAFNKQQAIEYQDMLDIAHDELGIDLQLDPSSAEFAKQFLALSQDRQGILSNELFIKASQAKADRSGRMLAGEWQSAVSGRTATIYEGIETVIAQANEIARKIARAPNNPNTLREVEEYYAPDGLRDQAVLEVQAQIVQLELDYANVPIRLQGTESYDLVTKMKEGSVAHLQTLLDALSSAEPRTAMGIFNTQQTIHKATLRAEFPEYQRIQTFLDDIDPKYWESFDAEADILLNDIGKSLQVVANSYLSGIYIDGGQGRPIPSDPSILRKQLRADRSANDRVNGTLARTDTEVLEVSASIIERDTRNLVNFNKHSTPTISAQSLNAVASALDEEIDLRNPAPNQIDLAWANATDQGTFDKIIKAKELSSNIVATRNWAEVQEDFLQEAGGVSRQMELINESLAANAGGVQARTRLAPDFSLFEEQGIITYFVMLDPKQGDRTNKFASNIRATVTKQLEERAVALGDRATTIIRLLGAIKLARGKANKINWMEILVENDMHKTIVLPTDEQVVASLTVQ